MKPNCTRAAQASAVQNGPTCPRTAQLGWPLGPSGHSAQQPRGRWLTVGLNLTAAHESLEGKTGTSFFPYKP